MASPHPHTNDIPSAALQLTTHLYPTPLLCTQPFNALLVSMINTAFGPDPLFPPSQFSADDVQTEAALSHQRLETPHQLSSELGPHGFTYVTFAHRAECTDPATDGGIIVATASAKPFDGKPIEGLEEQRIGDKMLIPQEDEGAESVGVLARWELTAVAIPEAGGWRGRGLAENLIGLAGREARRKHIASLEGRGGGGEATKIYIRCVAHTNGARWIKKGFVPEREERYPKGTWGEMEDWTLLTAAKDVY